MNKKINILVLGVGGNVSQGIMTAVRLADIPNRLIGTCISHESLGLYFCDSAYISPYADDELFLPWLINICQNEKVDIIFSGVEEIIVKLEENRDILQVLSVVFISSSLEVLKIGNDKFLTCEWLRKNGLNYPLYALSSDVKALDNLVRKVGFPLVAKPIAGKGSSGVMVIKSVGELHNIPHSNYIVQECLGDDDSEYTVGCYINKERLLENMIVMRRTLKYGTTFKAEIVHDRSIESECRKICSRFGAVGPLNIQLRIHKGKPVCFELNVRFSGTTPLRARWGFNDVKAVLDEYVLCQPLCLAPFERGLAYRYFNEAYVDPVMQQQLESSAKVEDCHQYDNLKESL